MYSWKNAIAEADMGKFVDRTGQKINSWVVKERGEDDKSGCVRWLCVCKCGRERLVHTQSLARNASTKCRVCCETDNKGIHSVHFHRIKWGAKVRGLQFSVTREEIWKLYEQQNGVCAISGLPIVFANTRYGDANGETTASLDRKDSSLGYFLANVQWVHKEVNRMKGSLSDQELVELCSRIVTHAQV